MTRRRTDATRDAARSGRPVERVDFAGRVDFVPRGAAPRADSTLVARETPEGFLRLEGRINGCGVYEYEDASGNTWGELRLPEHVFAPATLEGWKLAILTDDHPADFVTPENAADLAVGSIGSNVRPDPAREYTLADIGANDLAYIRKVKAGKTALSCGYTCTLIEQPGVYQGKPYRYIQTNIVPNHVSGVDVARGPGCAFITTDGIRNKSTNTMRTKKSSKKSSSKSSSKSTDAKVVIGEVEHEVPDEVAAEVEALRAKVEEQGAKLAELSALDAEGEEMIEEGDDEDMVEEPVDEDLCSEPVDEDLVEEPIAADGKARARARGRASGSKSNDALTVRMALLEERLAQQRDSFAREVSARVSLIETARAILGPKPALDSASNTAIQRAVIAKISPKVAKSLDGKSAEAIATAYHLALETHEIRRSHDSSHRLLTATGHAQLGGLARDSSGKNIDIDKIAADSRARMSGRATA